jgi:hypothetical protein
METLRLGGPMKRWSDKIQGPERPERIGNLWLMKVIKNELT